MLLFNKNQLSMSTTVAGVTVTTETEYDDMGNAVAQTDRRGFTTANTYDSCGRLLTTEDPLGNTTTYEYNDAGMQTKVIDSNGAVSETVYVVPGTPYITLDFLGRMWPWCRMARPARAVVAGEPQKPGSSGDTIYSS